MIVISIHAPRTGSDASGSFAAVCALRFQSTLPARGATLLIGAGEFRLSISIHAPRTGSDEIMLGDERSSTIFQSTLPARGATALRCIQLSSRRLFQSTLPARGATAGSRSTAQHVRFQSTLPARGATSGVHHVIPVLYISIHAPRTGSDFLSKYTAYAACHFNPRSPHGERLLASLCDLPFVVNFNPRSPHGERRFIPTTTERLLSFQSTLPARGATCMILPGAIDGGDFNPRSPHGERPSP